MPGNLRGFHGALRLDFRHGHAAISIASQQHRGADVGDWGGDGDEHAFKTNLEQ
jgi:hypothetical protein